MSAIADTSFLCALFRRERGDEVAEEYVREHRDPLVVTGLVRFEFLQGTRIEAWRHETQRRMGGYPLGEAISLQLRFDDEVRAGRLQMPAPDWETVFRMADEISERHTAAKGYRGFDILHLASAKALGLAEFLTFDAAQRTLAEAEGLVVPL